MNAAAASPSLWSPCSTSPLQLDDVLHVHNEECELPADAFRGKPAGWTDCLPGEGWARSISSPNANGCRGCAITLKWARTVPAEGAFLSHDHLGLPKTCVLGLFNYRYTSRCTTTCQPNLTHAHTVSMILALLTAQLRGLLWATHLACSCLAAYYVSLDHDAQAVRIVIRGTSVLKDLLTDFKGVAAPFMSGGYTHWFGVWVPIQPQQFCQRFAPVALLVLSPYKLLKLGISVFVQWLWL